MLIAIVLALGVSSFASPAPATAPAALELPPEVQSLTDRLLEDMQQRWYMLAKAADGLKRLEEAGDRFDRDLQELARMAPPDVVATAKNAEARDIRAKLITIAADRARRPEIYSEIDHKYIHFPIDREMRAPVVPFPDRVYFQEKYRLAWEYWLLWPGFDLPRGHVDEAVLYALQKIGNPASLVSLEVCYLLTCREVASPHEVQRSQLYLLRSLAGFKTEDGLRAVLRCLAESKKLPYRNHPDYTRGWRWDDGGPAEHVARLMSEPAVRAKWAEILQRMDRSALPNVQRGILDRVERSVQQATRPAP